jgi:mRNA interferase MazF
MTICDAGDVVIVPFPFTDIAVAKPRPALALSAHAANEASGNTIFAMVTTAARSHWPHDLQFMDAQVAGLTEASMIRMKLFTLDNRLISRKIGALSARDRQSVRRILRQLIAV